MNSLQLHAAAHQPLSGDARHPPRSPEVSLHGAAVVGEDPILAIVVAACDSSGVHVCLPLTTMPVSIDRQDEITSVLQGHAVVMS
jgi:hypothetical protein